MTILLTGGAGYLGTHTAVALNNAGRNAVILDNFSNSKRSVINKVAQITGQVQTCIDADVRDTDKVISIIKEYAITEVIHFAALKSLGESLEIPLEYYSNNIEGLISLLKAMQVCKLHKLVFSSTAAVYGSPIYLPCDESHPLAPQNPYGKSKLMAEQILQDLATSDPFWSIACLRYFNPVGAHESGMIGEDPQETPNNLLPYITNVASGGLPFLNIYGSDYPTKDGTGERDYIHVMDLSEGHLSALDYLNLHRGFHVFNLGTGKSVSVLGLLNAFEGVTGVKIQTVNQPRRAGDLPICFANVKKATGNLGWVAKRSIENACLSAWNFQKNLVK